MAFCNSCGAPLTAGTKFCNKCGTAAAAVPPAPGMMSAPPPSTGGSSALKIILIVIAVIVGIGILSVAALSFFVYHVAKNAHVTQNGDQVKVETPFGSMETSKDPDQVAKDLGIDIYPGAQVQKNGTATFSFGNMRTVAAVFEVNDSVDKVCDFYKSRFPAAQVTSSDQHHCSIVSGDPKNMININIQGSGDVTKLQISSVKKPN